MDEPDELCADILKLEERKAYLEEVKLSYLKAQNIISYIQQDIDVTDWQIRACKSRPPESIEIPKPIEKDELEAENQYLMGVYSVLNIPSESQLFSSTSVTISGGSAVYNYINRVSDLGTPSAIEYGSNFIFEYNQLQNIQRRPQQVRILMEKIKSKDLIERFDSALEIYLAYRSGSGKRTAIGNEFRNLLYGFKGELWNLARRFPKENMTWGKMAARVAINGGGGPEHVILNAQSRVHSSLLDRLADILKNREGGSITNLDSIWAETLDHLYAVLGLIK